MYTYNNLCIGCYVNFTTSISVYYKNYALIIKILKYKVINNILMEMLVSSYGSNFIIKKSNINVIMYLVKIFRKNTNMCPYKSIYIKLKKSPNCQY